MRVVIADGDLTYPATSGKRLRTLHLMLRLARRHRITYLCRCDGHGRESQQARAYLGDHGIETVLVEQPRPRKSGLLFYARLAANLFSALPYSVASHACANIRQALRAHAASHRVDLWQFEWPAYADALDGLPGLRTLIVAHNVDSLIWQRYYQTESKLLRRWYIKHQWHKYQRFERRIYAGASRVVTCTEEDAAIVRGPFGVPNVDVVENGMDREYFAAAPAACRDAKQILFLGALDYRPNADAVDQLLDRILPEVRRQEPDARLCIVGRNPGETLVERVSKLDNVEVHGDVADVRPFLAQSAVMAVPLRIGGGSRLKILEALACGLPVVSTRVGTEGLCFIDGRDLDVVESVEQMSAALVDALRNPGRAQAMAEQGRRLVLERYDWDVLAQKLETVWEKCLLPERNLMVRTTHHSPLTTHQM